MTGKDRRTRRQIEEDRILSPKKSLPKVGQHGNMGFGARPDKSRISLAPISILMGKKLDK